MRCRNVFGLVSFLCLGLQPLGAIVHVTSSANSGAGSLREAVEGINATTATSPISLDAGIDPSITTNMTSLTASASLVATNFLTVHTITGNGNIALSVGAAEVTLSISEDIQFASAELLINEGTIQLNGLNNLTGVTAVEISGVAPILQFSGSASGTFGANLSLLGTQNNLKVDAALTITETGAITGTVLGKQGTGTLILPNANIFVGGTVIAGGTVEMGNNTSLGSGAITMQTGTTLVLDAGLSVSNTFTLEGLPQTISVPSGVAVLSGVLSGAGSLVFSGPGVLELLATNTFTGTTTIASGTLILSGANGSMGTSSAVSISAGAILDLSDATALVQMKSLSGAGSVVLGSQSISISQLSAGVFSGVISGSGDLILATTSTNTLTLTGVNTYTGSTTISGGTLALAGSGSIMASSSLTDNGSFDISGVTVGASVKNLSGTGTIALGGKILTVIQTTGGSLSGVISGGLGSLVLDATSTRALILSAVNTYTGQTLINGGILALSGSGSIASSSSVVVDALFDIHEVTSSATIQNLSGTGEIALGSKTLIVNQTAAGTFSGVIAGVSGGLALGSISTSTLTLSDVNTYTGATVIGAGTLALSGAGSIALSSSLTIGGTFDISGITTQTSVHNVAGTGNIVLGSKKLTIVEENSGILTGVISGSGGSLTLDVGSSAILGLQGVNTYTGPTEIFAGVLTLLGPGTIASSSSVLVDGVLDISNTSSLSSTIQNVSGAGYITLGLKSIVIDQSVSGEFSGMILGTIGGLTKTGAGTLTLSGSNVYTGTTTISAGTLIGNTKSLPSPIVNHGALIFEQMNSGTYAFAISGSGTVAKTGTGTLTLSANSSYTGHTTVEEGTLTVNGSISSSSTTVLSGATLAGHGTVGSIDIHGQVKPGPVLTVDGHALLETGSTYTVVINGNGASRLNVNDLAAIDSGVHFVMSPQSGFLEFVNKRELILSSHGRIGEFSSFTSTMLRVGGKLFYEGNDIFLTINVQPFSDLGFVGNSEQVAKAIDAVLDSGSNALNEVITSLLPLTNSQINSALNQMHPALFKALTLTQENNAVNIQEALSLRMQNELDTVYCYFDECKKTKSRYHIWTQGFGDNLHQKSLTYAQSPQFGYQSNTGGAVLGFDGHFFPYCYTGTLIGYTNSDVNWVGDHGEANVRTGYAGLYLSALGKIFYANASVIGGWNWFSQHRNIRYPGVSVTAKSHHGGKQLLSHLDTGINLGWKGITIRPFDAFDYIVQKEDGYMEAEAGPYNLHVKQDNAILMRNELGVQLAACMSFSQSKWTLSPKVSWVREMRIKGSQLTANFDNTHKEFMVTGYFPDRNLISPGLALSGVMWCDLMWMDLYYNGEFAKGYSDHSYGGQIRFGF